MSQLTTRSHHDLDTSFGPVRCWETGPGDAPDPPLVFLQGLLAGPTVWSGVVAPLAERWRCVTADWPFGAHQRPMLRGADLSPPGLARMVIEVLDQLGIERAVMVGNDSGGVISQLAVAAAPERIESLVLVACDAFEVFPPGAYRHLFRLAHMPGTIRLLGAALNTPAFARSRLGFGAVMLDTARVGKAQKLLTDRLIRRDLRTLMTGSSNTQTLAAAETFEHFQRPVLVVWAEEDLLFPRSLGQRLAAAFPEGRLVTVPGSRTFVPIDQPSALSRLIAQLLERVQTG